MAYPVILNRTNTGDSQFAAASTNMTWDFASPSNGDALLTFISYESPTSRPLTLPSGWSQVGSFDDRIAFITLLVLWKVCDGTEGTSASATFNSSAQFVARTLRIQAGTYSGSPAISSGANDGTTAPQSATLTTGFGTSDKRFFSAFAGNGNNYTVTAYPSGYGDTSNIIHGSGASPIFGMAEKESTADADTPGAFTLSSLTEWSALTVAVNGAAPSGPSAATLAHLLNN